MKTLLLLILFYGCGQLNQRERDEFVQNEKMRHGIVPIETPKKVVMGKKMLESSRLKGKEIYLEHCLSCHGPKGLGDGPLAHRQKTKPANLQKTVKEVKDFEFYLSISQYEGSMPGWVSRLDYREREDLVIYLQSLVDP